ncbi:hypothetical protein M409DRAFT_15650 [Zasmidium cellare ATCC 36951]|uniref:Uncharacterized protein n=1 Tax=Zasmidium cellare ATCC 36951 TaxID=1080233 RepID=A0A6A6D2F2_ZASCE|nr:uncharacterized protein M409DRAFT_15650 [Zasmidium cellare ATCC 36951]KAF2173365.1 hypothetical protein M409DRAFT_15650 [Zasmidium cellare ATCC 36951]
MTPFEFSRLPALFDVLLWKIAPGLGEARSKSARIYRRRIYLLLLLIISLCALCNLMGPATAVLVLPTLQWIDTANVGNSSFVGMNAANPPQAGNWFIQTSNCTANEAQTFNYSCAAPTFGSALDVWLESIRNTAPGVTQQDQLTFNINTTYSISTDGPLTARYNSSLYWAPNREILSNLSADFLAVGLLSLGVDEKTWEQNVGSLDSYNSYAEYNSSLNLAILRNGPILGAIVNNWISFDNASVTVVEVAPNQQIRCYDSYNLDSFDGTSSGNYTKCIQTGTGWSPSNKMSNFSVAGTYDYATTRVVRPDTQISIFSSEKAAFLENGVLPDWLPGDCLRNGTVPTGTNCDYNRLFTMDHSSPVANRSSNVNTMEMTTRQNTTSVTAAIDFIAFLGFTTYTLDASPITNPSQVIQTEDIDNTQTSITIDPSWMLADFSADAGSIQSPDHSTSQQLSNLMNTFLSLAQQPNPSTDSLSDTDQNNYYYLTMISIAQTLSIIDINTSPSTSSSTTTQTHPLLHRSARMNVWAYSASSSRTAILGTIVAIIGIVVTLIQFVMSLWDKRPFRSSTQLLVAALEHVPRDEFRGRQTSEEGVARVRFHVREALEGVGFGGGGDGKEREGDGDGDGGGGLVGRIRFQRTEG